MYEGDSHYTHLVVYSQDIPIYDFVRLDHSLSIRNGRSSASADRFGVARGVHQATRTRDQSADRYKTGAYAAHLE